MPKKFNRWVLMCPDIEEAKRNRERIADKELNREYWDELAEKIRKAKGTRLPADIPIGSLPEVGGSKAREMHEEVLGLDG